MTLLLAAGRQTELPPPGWGCVPHVETGTDGASHTATRVSALQQKPALSLLRLAQFLRCAV